MDGCKGRETEMDVDDNGKRMNGAARRVCERGPATESKAGTVAGGPARRLPPGKIVASVAHSLSICNVCFG